MKGLDPAPAGYPPPPKDLSIEGIFSQQRPHTYCIGANHLLKNEGMYLDIPATEAKGAACETCKHFHRKDPRKYPILTHDQHISERGLVIRLPKQPTKEHIEYLKSLDEYLTKNGLIGFAFLEATEDSKETKQ